MWQKGQEAYRSSREGTAVKRLDEQTCAEKSVRASYTKRYRHFSFSVFPLAAFFLKRLAPQKVRLVE
jgi:hypothetical protein